MPGYDKEFIDFMKEKYDITPKEGRSGREAQIITFAVAWNVWKEAKRVYSKG